MTVILGRQVRAARSLLEITRDTLSKRCGLPPVTIQTVENERGDPRASTLDKITTALLRSGVEFLDADGGKGPGVRLARPVRPKKRRS
jgi:transcriptional regulator with XRE-family HTH domain